MAGTAVYKTENRVVTLVNRLEPLAAKESVYNTPKKDALPFVTPWKEDKDFLKSLEGLRGPEVTIDDPIKKSISDNLKNEQRHATQNGKDPFTLGESHSSSFSSGKKKRLPSTSSEAKGSSIKKKSLGGGSVSLDDHPYDEMYEIPEDNVPQRGDSQRKLTSGRRVEKPCCPKSCKSARCIVIIVVIVMLLVAAGVIAGILHFALKDNQPNDCKESFVTYEGKFVLGSTLFSNIKRSADCAAQCLRDPVCGGYDFDRVKKNCYVVSGVVPPNLMLDALSTDHFQRDRVCNKTKDTSNLCIMIHSSNGNVKGGHSQGVMSMAQCKRRCLMEPSCMGVDFAIIAKKCYIHIVSDNTVDNDCCLHFSKSCKRCDYSQVRHQYSKAALRVPHIEDESECGALCDAKSSCWGFDFHPLHKECALIHANYTTTNALDVWNYRKGVCYDIKAPT